MDCRECLEIWREKWRWSPPCDTCSFPGLWLENLDAWQVLSAASSSMFDGMGGVRLENARLVCEGLGLRWEKAMMRKVLEAARVMLENSRDK